MVSNFPARTVHDKRSDETWPISAGRNAAAWLAEFIHRNCRRYEKSEALLDQEVEGNADKRQQSHQPPIKQSGMILIGFHHPRRWHVLFHWFD